MSRATEIKTYTYSGPLREAIEKFIAEKRGMGLQYNSAAERLANFDRFSIKFGYATNVLSKEVVEAWTARRPNEGTNTQRLRVTIIRELGVFMQRCGYEAYIAPKDLVKKTGSNYVPYIFSDDEIARIFKQAVLLKPSPQAPIGHIVIPLFMRMLYYCGLRVSEARYLKVKDVDLENGILTIQGTKFDKDRLVPMSPFLTEQCRIYSDKVHKFSDPEAFYFPNARNNIYGMLQIYDAFRKILWKAGISHGGKGKGPRIHDLRYPNLNKIQTFFE
ncbi:MAG: tyrosine-type recombinase/integrase [Firmicutes bacterium]|nr:tyrosine-type recombinase/integrase [Bacillota bacterium]